MRGRGTDLGLATSTSGTATPFRSVLHSIVNVDIEFVAQFRTLLSLCAYVSTMQISKLKGNACKDANGEKLTSLDTLNTILESLFVHLSFFELLDLDLFSVLLEISLFLRSF